MRRELFRRLHHESIADELMRRRKDQRSACGIECARDSMDMVALSDQLQLGFRKL